MPRGEALRMMRKWRREHRRKVFREKRRSMRTLCGLKDRPGGAISLSEGRVCASVREYKRAGMVAKSRERFFEEK